MVSFYCLFLSFFFFKQKTAYEMRISDWSSDVCSSDLKLAHLAGRKIARRQALRDHRLPAAQPLDHLGRVDRHVAFGVGPAAAGVEDVVQHLREILAAAALGLDRKSVV